jgi:hypothetical protein
MVSDNIPGLSQAQCYSFLKDSQPVHAPDFLIQFNLPDRFQVCNIIGNCLPGSANEPANFRMGSNVKTVSYIFRKNTDTLMINIFSWIDRRIQCDI